MFTRAQRIIRQRKEIIFKGVKCLFKINFDTCLLSYQKSVLQRVKTAIMSFKECDKIQNVSIIKRTVPETEQRFQVLLLMIDHKVVRCAVHASHQLIALVDNGFSLAPSHNRSQKAHNFDILSS